MVLDNDQQRDILLKIVRSTSVSGSYEQAKDAVAILDELLSSIEGAVIEQQEQTMK